MAQHSGVKSEVKILNAATIVAALGYFVDVYDLVLFSIVRVPSLQALGLQGDELLDQGVLLLNMQMIGMLIGGVLWGIWGDKKGRLSVLFGSILMYSLANIFNGFVNDIPTYAVLRLIAGIGLAGELGAGITLVAEILPKEKRGLGTTIVATVGVMGAIVAALVGDKLDWRNAYFVGGGLGLLLLFLRISVRESGMYQAIENKHVAKGDLTMLFKSSAKFKLYMNCILSGLPIWAVLGILMTFAPEVARALNIQGDVTAGRAVLYTYIGLTVGDLLSGLLSQFLKSRKKVIALFAMLTGAFTVLLINMNGVSVDDFYLAYIPLGVAVGYWAVFITTSAEQFGTNLRSTVTTSAPNFVRGAAVPLTFLFQYFKPSLGVLHAAGVVILSTVVIALLSLRGLKESYHQDLDFVE